MTAPRWHEDEAPTPDEAFATLGDQTRLQVLKALGAADRPLAFSELFDRIEYDSTANFSYHLERLQGHFVRKTEAGYELRRAGERVVEAVLSGAVTETPVLERTPVEAPCPRCGGTLEVSYREEAVGLFCADCGGTRGGASPTAAWAGTASADIIGHVYLPPAGVRDRTPRQLLDAAEVWTVAEAQARARGVCPRCAGRLRHEVRVCGEHPPGGDHCDACDQQFAVTLVERCRNCIFGLESIFTIRLLADPHLMAFMLDHGIDPMAPEGFHVTHLVDETVESVDPFEAAFTFASNGESLRLTVGDDLSVVEASRGSTAPTAADTTVAVPDD